MTPIPWRIAYAGTILLYGTI